MMSLKNELKNAGHRLGFDLVCVSSAEPLESDRKRYQDWVKEGYAASLSYMTREFPRRWVPQDLLPETKCIFTFAVNFFSGTTHFPPKVGFGKVARYAWGKDYHIVIRKRLEEWVKVFSEIAGRPVKTKILVDSSPLLERAFSDRGGLGFVGKNTLMISRQLGSFLFLSEVLSDLEMEPDVIKEKKSGDPCGSCRECIDRCPTGAIVSSRALDARKCISYWTIENREEIPEPMRTSIGDWIFGCDICQDVCPYNAVPNKTQWDEFLPEWGTGPYLSLLEVLSIKTDEDFRKKFLGTPILRAKRTGLIRNACVVAGNQCFKEAVPNLKKLFEDDQNPMVQIHAKWALDRLA